MSSTSGMNTFCLRRYAAPCLFFDMITRPWFVQQRDSDDKNKSEDIPPAPAQPKRQRTGPLHHLFGNNRLTSTLAAPEHSFSAVDDEGKEEKEAARQVDGAATQVEAEVMPYSPLCLCSPYLCFYLLLCHPTSWPSSTS